MDGLIYAFGAPRSNVQQAFIAQRIAEQRKQRRASAVEPRLPPTSPPIPQHRSRHSHQERRSTIAHVATSPTLREESEDSAPPSSAGDINPIARANTGGSASSNWSEAVHQQLLDDPYELRHGRRYLRDVPYCLPSDLPELQRQNLRTLLACQVFGRAVCAPRASQDIPQRVLEIGCGTGYWSTMCHDYFCSLGYDDVSFTGLDIAPLAPDLGQQGLNWTFVQHDIRRLPLPFDDDEFDLVMLKDLSLTLPSETSSNPPQRLIAESIRILRGGGTLEVWETDYCLRSVVTTSTASPDADSTGSNALTKLGVLSVGPSTPFASVQNRFLQQANDWIYEALSQRRLPPTPCSRVAQFLFQEGDNLVDLGMERIAIPLTLQRGRPDASHDDDRADSPLSKTQTNRLRTALTADQISLRQTALMTVVQLIESLEPILREISGKSPDEWNHWWTMMMADLSDSSKPSLKGECLEMGAWWASKVDHDE